MRKFNNIEVYVRISADSYEGQSLRFVTLDEDAALNKFITDSDSEIYAPDHSGEELQIWVDGEYVESYTRSTDKKWFKNYYSRERVEYGKNKP